MLCHRLRHAAPAGASPLPVNGFCAGLVTGRDGDGGVANGSASKLAFITLHDRIGRIGSQRLTLFNGYAMCYITCYMLPVVNDYSYSSFDYSYSHNHRYPHLVFYTYLYMHPE